MKVKCSFCFTGYDAEKTQGYCPNCGKKYDETTESFGEKPQSFAPYGSQNNQTGTQGGDYGQNDLKPTYVNHSTVKPVSMDAYLSRSKEQGMGGGRVAAIIVVVTLVITAAIVMLVLTSAKDHDTAYDDYYAASKQEAMMEMFEASDFSQSYIENYTQGDMEGASSREQIEVLFEDFQNDSFANKGQFDDYIFQWLYFNSEDDEIYNILEQATKDSGDERLLAEVYLLRYNLSEDENYLELAQTAMKPEEYFYELDVKGALPEMLEKPYSDITWKDIGRITHVEVLESGSKGYVLGEDGEVLYSTLFSNGERGYGPLGFYGTTNLEVSKGDYRWGIPFYMTELENLIFDNSHMGMNLSQLDYFGNLTRVIPRGEALTDPAVLETVKLTSMELGNRTTQEEAENIPDSIVDLVIDDSGGITNLDFLDSLPNLKTLRITGTEVTDFAPLHSKTTLETLALIGTNIKDVSFLEDFENLTTLTLENNSQLISCKGIEAVSTLERLFIRGDLEGIEGISALGGIKELGITYPKSVAMISDLKELKKLTIVGGGMIEDIKGLSGLTELEYLKFDGGSASTSFYFGLEALSGLESLKTLHIEGISIFGSGSSIFSLENLEELHLKDSDINLGGGSFNTLPNLKTLDISKTVFIYNVSIWSDGPFTSIDYDTLTPAEVGGKIGGAPSLENLVMQSTKTDDLSFASDLKELKTLDVTDNYITELTPLLGLENLEVVIVSGNPLKADNGEKDGHFIVVK